MSSSALYNPSWRDLGRSYNPHKKGNDVESKVGISQSVITLASGVNFCHDRSSRRICPMKLEARRQCSKIIK